MSGTIVGITQRASQNQHKEGPTDHPVYREWAPLSHLIEKIPPRFHQGFVSKELILTCVTISCDSIVLGSNAGVLFWFGRSNHSVNRRSVDDKFIPITALAITLCQYGEILATGNLAGTVAIFSTSAVQSSPITAFSGEHKSSVTTLCWDGSGIHLLSGDEEGRVFLSKFEHNIIRPIKQVLLEPSSIVQLRFHPLENNIVLVSSMKRTLVAEIVAHDTKQSQVGLQDRKNPAPFGADFGYFGNETVIYSARPGTRLWLSDCQGSVRQTLIFKESLSKPRSKLILLSIHEEYRNVEDPHFGPVYCLSNGFVLTHSPSSLFILDTGRMGDESGQVSVLCSSRFNPKSLRHAAIFHNEIFLLLENRILIRISDRPDRSPTVSSSSATLDRSLLSGWRDKLPLTKPTFQSTITKLANRISDVEIKPLSVPVTNTAPYIIESLSNALAPLFNDMKTVPISRCAPPKPIQPHFLNRTRTPSPTSSVERSSPMSQTEGMNRSESNQFDSPLSNGSSGQASPMERSICPEEEQLVYGSYIGRKRKLKLNRKFYAQDEVMPFVEPCETTPVNGVETWLENASSPPVVKDDFLEELKRKDELLAQLLHLDQVINSPNEPAPLDEEQVVETEQMGQPTDSEMEVAAPVSEDTSSIDEELESDSKDNVCSIYANEDPLDKSNPHSIPTSTESTPSHLAVSSGDYENISVEELSEWIICPIDAKRKVTSVSASQHYVVIVYSHKYVYYQSTESSFQARDWLPIETPASQIAVSSSGQQLWRLYKGTAYQGLIVNPHCPVAQHWNALDSYISSIGIVQLVSSDTVDDYIWMLHTNGSVSYRSVKSPKKMVLVDVPGTVSQLRCHNDLVLILLTNGALYCRSRISNESPMGVGWQRQDTPGELVTMALSPDRYLWALNQSEQMFFRTAHDKRWWQVSSVLPPEWQLKSAYRLNVSSIFKRQSSRFELALTNSRICLALLGSSLLITAQNLIGYSWEKFAWANGLYYNDVQSWHKISANGFNHEDKVGVVWLIDDKQRLYCFYGDEQLEQVSLPTDSPIRHLSVIGNQLWLLTTDGEIFVRVKNLNPVGSGWVNLSTAQFQSSNKLRYVSLGPELAWACDQHGQIYFRSGDNGPPTLLAPAWIAVDELDISFKEIHVSSSLAVWALDNNGCVYVRQGVTRQLPIGTGWNLVNGVEATQLAVSGNAIWALTNDGSIFRRSGISQQNHFGNKWCLIPGSFRYISVTIDDKLWVLDSNGEVYQLLTSSPLKSDEGQRYEVLHLDEDWVLL